MNSLQPELSPAAGESSLEMQIARLADDFLERQERGEHPEIEEFAARCPEHAAVVRNVLTALALMRFAAAEPASAANLRFAEDSHRANAPDGKPDVPDLYCTNEPAGTLGDFRIVREIGRGGMGVVYEAEQISLPRRVALKVLPFAAMLDPRALQRFKNEAQAAALVDHPNIVDIYAVGHERGVHFYAMRLVDGQTLSAVIDDLRGAQQPFSRDAQRSAPPAPPPRPAPPQPLPAAAASPGPSTTAPSIEPAAPALRCASRLNASDDFTAAHIPESEVRTPNSALETLARAGSTVQSAIRNPQSAIALPAGKAFHRRVAELGIAVAEALDHAHQQGVIHRDIKPSNLILDSRGKIWVTDLGLAHIESAGQSMTRTGDLLGTLRYMSPEQAQGRPAVIDHRTDIYSLGATLYELLALHPVFEGANRQALLRMIACEEPRPLRQVDKSIPVELETIALKALEKEPADRYATAQELADDLGRFLQHQPLRGRRQGVARRMQKWMGRHKALSSSLATALAAAALTAASAVSWAFSEQVARESKIRAVANQAVEESLRLQQQGQFSEALQAVKRAREFLASGGAALPMLRQEVDRRARDLETAIALQKIRVRSADVENPLEAWRQSDREYAEAFANYGLDTLQLEPADLARRVQNSSVPAELINALDDWAGTLRSLRTASEPTSRPWKQVLEVAHLADRDEMRSEIRAAWQRNDTTALQRIAASKQVEKLNATSLVLLAEQLDALVSREESIALLRRGQRQHPGDFWVNVLLADQLYATNQPLQAIPFYTAALALRPLNAGVASNLGLAHLRCRDHADAIACFERTIEIEATYALAHGNLGLALREIGELDRAEQAFRQAIQLRADHPNFHFYLGILLSKRGEFNAAIRSFREAIRLKPDFAEAHVNLGLRLAPTGAMDEARQAFEEALRHNPNLAVAHLQLGQLHRKRNALDEAIAAYSRAIQADAQCAEAYFQRGQVYHQMDALDDAIQDYRSAIRCKEDFGAAYNNLGNALRENGETQQAIAAVQESVRLDPTIATRHFNLGVVLAGSGAFQQAAAAFRSALTLDPMSENYQDSLDVCEVLVPVETQLDEILSGKVTIDDPTVLLALATHCLYFCQDFAAATGFYAQAFAIDASLTGGRIAHRARAASAAVQAGCYRRRGAPTIDEAQRTKHRIQALAWLRAELDIWNEYLRLKPAEAPVVQRGLEDWRTAKDFAGVRDDAALANLPAAEQAEWRKFWGDVAALLAKAGKAAAPLQSD